MHTQSQNSAALDIAASVGRFRLLKFLCVAFLPASLALTSIEASATDTCESFEKQVSFDGGLTWFDADDPNMPAQGFVDNSEYRFVLNNCETNKLCVDTRVRDDILGITDPNNANGVLVGDGILQPGEQVIVTKNDPGFENLDQPGQCIPMNTATESTFVGTSTVPEIFDDPAYVDCLPPPPAIDIEKATNDVDADDPNAGDAPQIAPGDLVTWSYLVTNTGGVPLANLTVFDDQIGPINCPQTTLEVDESILCVATGFAEDLENTSLDPVPGTCGSTPNRPLYENMGTATGTYLRTGEMVMDDDPSHYCNPEEPAIDIEKATNGVDADNPNAGDAPQIEAGDTVTWSYVVTNTGTVPLLNVVAFDDTLGVTLNCPKNALAPMESMICDSISMPAVQLELGDPGVVEGTCGNEPGEPLYENISRVMAQSESGTPVQDQDPSHYCNPPPPPDCGLTVLKGCEIPPPPPPAPGKCEGRLTQLTMIWDGTSGTLVNGPGFNGTVNNGDEVVFQGPFSDNDVVVNVGSGTSTFHTSCSDKDMDGDTETNEDQQQVSTFGRDCGKFQGNGKGDSGINQWLLEGFIDDDGAVLDCTVPTGGPIVSSCEFFAEPVSCETFKPDNLTWQYTGGGCGASNNNQDSGDLFCTGSVNGSLPVTIVDDGGNVFNVDPGGSFTTSRGDSKVFTLSNAGGTEQNGRHVSCSQPLEAGDVYGSLTLARLDGQGLGADVIYSYLISNNGTETITGITAIDNVLGTVPGSPLAALVPGDSTTLTATTFVTETVTNTVTVDGSVPSGAECLATASSTVTALGPPPCSVSIVLDKIEDKKIKWKLTNNSSSRTATIESLTISWPGDESLKKIKFDGSDILKDDLRNPPSTTVVESEWLKEVKDRRLDVGDSGKNLEIEFTDDFPLEKNQPASDFVLTVTFSEGCSVTF